MKSTIEIIAGWNSENKGFIHQQTAFGNGTNDDTIETIMQFIADTSTGFQADIAKRALENSKKYGRIKLSEKQAWCIEYEMLRLASQFTNWANKNL